MSSDNHIQMLIASKCDAIKAMLLAKNKAYGNSALDPVRIFSKANVREQILVRIDDKLSRIAKGNSVPGEDTIADLIGYLHLLQIADELSAKPTPKVYRCPEHGAEEDRCELKPQGDSFITYECGCQLFRKR